jgi:YidC/Oxa1 family membrane protein insertase
MDKNTVIGFGLIFLLMMAMTYMNRPTEEQLAAAERKKDSLAQINNIDTTQQLAKNDTTALAAQTPIDDSLKIKALSSDYGVFANAAIGEAKEVSIENDVFKIIFNTKGGNIKEVQLKGYEKFVKQKDNTFKKEPLSLLDDAKNKFEYILPVAGATKGSVKSSDLYFTPTIEGNSITLRASAGDGKYFEQKYAIVAKDEYTLDYHIAFVGLDKVVPNNAKSVQLNWDNYLSKLEKNATSERSEYSGVHYRVKDESSSSISDNTKDLDKEIQWVSSTQQFFNTTIIAKNNFTSAKLVAKPLEEEDENLKRNSAEILIPFNQSSNEIFAMQMYIGPNDFEKLRAFDNKMEDNIEFGWGVFGSINRWVIRPVFSFISNYVGNAGIVILILTFIVKMVLYPLSYGMLYSQAKMAALKPELDKIKERTGDDQQAYSAEQMKLYQQTGVNPLGGCMPMLLQMPIWLALYRFFPASIEFRHKNFLWADDLSSYDAITTFDIPWLTSVGLDHISLFSILWAISTLVYTYYSTRHMTMPNPAMQYVQYLMPIMFVFFFNSVASGLTCYLFFSTILNIGQTIFTKEVLIDKKKIEKLLEENRKKPKKTTGFQARLQEAMKQQEELKKQQAKTNAELNKNKKK